MWQKTCAALIVSAAVLTGCDDKNNNSTATAPPTSQLPPGIKARPTTQQLQDRVKLDLKYDPISLMVPPSWELKTVGDNGDVTLDGYSPSDVIHIRIPAADIISDGITPPVPAAIRIARLEADAKAHAALHPDLIKAQVVRSINGGATVIEDIYFGSPSTQPSAAPADPNPEVQWSIKVCVPSNKQYNVYELRFTGLTLSTFKADQDFLRSIIDSITYNPADTLVK